jgi:hypothetical protein
LPNGRHIIKRANGISRLATDGGPCAPMASGYTSCKCRFACASLDWNDDEFNQPDET